MFKFHSGESLLLPLFTTIILSTTVALAPAHDVPPFSVYRVRRQALSSPQLWPGPPGKLNVPIPTNIAVFGGNSELLDTCPRDEVTLETDGSCQQLLTQGSCQADEYVLLNPDTNRGYCAPRLCPPDRVFVFSTQLCHDPREPGICPPGRELYESSYGTPVCACPDGTYEGDDDLDDDVCEPVLGSIQNCPAGQVFWFRDLNLGPECLPDPCNGLNLKREPNDLMFLPSLINGKCFQMGSSKGVCPSNTWYGLDLDSLKGVCATLEEFGYNVFNGSTLNRLLSDLGSPIAEADRTVTTPLLGNTHQQNGFNQQSLGNQASINQNQISNNNIQSNQIIQPGNHGGNPVKNPIQTINQIQKQIGDLQQQLEMLQQTLQGANKNNQNNNAAQSRQSPIDSTPADVNTLNRGMATVIKATLQKHISTSSSPPSTSNGNHHTNGNNKVSSIPQQVNNKVSPGTLPARGHIQSRISSPSQSSVTNNFNQQQNIQQHGQNANPNIQIHVEPMNFVHFQNQQQQQIHGSTGQFQSIEVFGPGGQQQFHNGQLHGGKGQFQSIEVFGPGGQQRFGGQGPMSIEVFGPGGQQQQSIEQFEGRFIQQNHHKFGRRKKRSARNRVGSRPRRRRSPLPHASPANVFESRLLGCRGGAIRDINSKCRNVILPSRVPRRPIRAAPPTRPRRPCSGVFNIFRRCVSSAASAQSKINSFGLG